ncbi:Sapep family Mn(2+)-dependent dipeptidase [Hyalangium rubrum]|uniref:Sapep family Mn(2+)-dependent dipeptidase n=1 Tax=Hyalangium rubrum TaxID=3103134 RepID=A0ABU5H9D3_9BACT|nr:Sapep family Mn(2+)-dependent dipeptidase [Hyalangium sp. s54d21]MDY7230090.1 Sapep family Mn(2+)-dependent dipeptidase [Hyalangium sp. s54d21]
MRLDLFCLGLVLLASAPALAQGSRPKLTPAQLREIERENQKLQDRLRKQGVQAEVPKAPKGDTKGKGKEKGKEAEPKPPNCQLAGAKRTAQFSEEALPGIPLTQRYALYVSACGLGDVVALTQQLVRFKTVSSEQPAAKSPGIAAMGRFLQKWAQTHGFAFRTVGQNDVFELAWGEGAPHLGFIFHGDVVPAPAHEWKSNPFEAKVRNGRLYGRGVMDDKGPIAMGLVSLAMAKEMGLKPHKGKVLLIIGNGEESDWKGMQEYTRTEVLPTHAVSVDSEYPVVVAQSGFVALTLEAALESEAKGEGTLVAVDASAGEFLTQVPGAAMLSLVPTSGTSLEQALAAAKAAVESVRKERSTLKAEVRSAPLVGLAGGGMRIVITTQGKAVHSSAPEQGQNALWDLSAIAEKLPLVDNGIAAMLRAVARRFDGDHHGDRLGFTGKDPLMGPMIVAATLLRVKEGKVSLGVNLRRPRSEEGDEDFHQALNHAVSRITQESDGRIVEGPGRYVGEPHVADVSGPLVLTLMDIYKRHQNIRSNIAPISIAGGTYARLFPRGVDFGPGLPGQVYTGHAPDEFISLEHLGLGTQMLAEALHSLALSANAR